jgi:putative Mn2+ efflux pump MntP
MIQIFLIAVSLAMDAFAVSVSSGICIRELRPFHAIRASLAFGLFQFLMPVIGWFLGSAFAAYIAAWDHWIAFILLDFIGGKMIIEAIGKNSGKEACDLTADIRKPLVLFNLAIATSIDALAVGISFSLLGHGVWLNAAIIGGVTFVICLIGFEFGRRIGFLFEKWAEFAGGVILVGLGIKILVEHLLTPGLH